MNSDRRFKLKMVLVVLAALGLGAWLTWSQFDSLHTRLAVFFFKRNPSQATADALVELLDAQVVSPSRARRILALLLTPRVNKADSYLFGMVPTVRVEFPFDLTFRNMKGDVTEEVYVDGQRQSGTRSEGAHTFAARTYSLRLHPPPTRPGVYKMEIRYSYCLTGERRPAWRWTSFKGLPLPRHQLIDIADTPLKERQYTCRFLIPLRIVVE